jgi:acyl dehydratase
MTVRRPATDSEAALLDGLPIGTTDRSVGRTISDGEFTLLHTLSWSFSELHTNKELMSQTSVGERLLAGPMLTAVVAGMHSSGEHFDELRRSFGLTFLAVLGIEADYRAPVLPGDTIWVDTTLASARASASRPGVGVMVFRDVAWNQRDEVVLEMERPMLFSRQATEPGTPAERES